jgi:hypothetical protein
MTTPSNYKETNVQGTKYKRAYRVEINNPLDGTPSAYIREQDVVILQDGNIYQNNGTLYTAFDLNNPLHVDIYNKLNDLYVALRTLRDSE